MTGGSKALTDPSSDLLPFDETYDTGSDMILSAATLCGNEGLKELKPKMDVARLR